MKLVWPKSSLLIYLRAIRHLFGRKTLEYLLLVSLPPKRRTKMPSLTNFNRFSRVRLFYYDVFDRIVYLQLPEPMDHSGCFSTPSPNTSLSSSSSSSGVRSLRRKQRASNYLMGTARAPFKSRTLEKSLSPLAPSTSTFRWVQVDSQPSDGTFQQVPSLSW